MNRPLDFPNNPHKGQIFKEWKWDGEKWVPLNRAGWAPIDSPDFVGMPTAPTPPPGSNDAKIATTAFVMEAIEHHIAGVSSFNHRTGHVFLELVDIVEAGGAPIHGPHFTGWPEAETAVPGTDSRIIATTEFVQDAFRRALENIVNSWNRRTGNVVLRWDDVEDVGGAPIREPVFLGFARGQTAPRRDETTRLANTIFVGRAIDDAREEIDEEIREVVRTSVRSWNQRTGHVTLRPSDLTAVGAAFLASPAFTGKPTAPTAPPDTNNQQLATTRYVDQAIRSNPGPPGAPGRPGEKGPPGPAGRGLVVVGHVARRQDLPRRDNEVGDIWTVGEDYEGFWWNGFVWLSLGFIRGARGPRGPAGPPTFIDDERPEDAERGDLWWNPEDRLFEIRVNGRWDQISPPVPFTVITSSDYNVRPIDDIIFYSSASGLRRLTLPEDVVGKRLIVIVSNFTGGSLRIIAREYDLIRVPFYGGAGWLYLNEITIHGPPIGGNSVSIELIKISGNQWVLNNSGPALYGTDINNNDRTILGLMPPPPLSTPSNAALQADMTWRVPGTKTVITSVDYTALPTDDWIWFENITAPVTLTLPSSLVVPIGKLLRVSINSMSVSGSLTITSPGSLAAFGGKPGNFNIVGGSYTIPGFDRGSKQILLQNIQPWTFINQSTPLLGTPVIPGLLPGPPAGTASNAALQADMTWRVPGTNVAAPGLIYNVLPTDDYIEFLTMSTSRTLIMPPMSQVPIGKSLRVIVGQPQAGVELIFEPSAGQAIYVIGLNSIWNVVTTSFTVEFPDYGRGTTILLYRTGYAWFLFNEGRPVLGRIGAAAPWPLPGLMPAPPAGTPASAVLHADMTWY